MWGCVFVVLFSCFTACLSEAISYLLIYRTDSYKKQKSQLERLQAKLQQVKDSAPGIENMAAKQKRIAALENELSVANRQMVCGLVISLSSSIAFSHRPWQRASPTFSTAS